MKNNLFKKVSAVLTAAGCMFCVPGFFISTYAYSNGVVSPQNCVQLVQSLMKNDGYVSGCLCSITVSDNIFSLTFNEGEDYAKDPYGLPEPSAGNIYFAVFKDHDTQKILARVPFTKGAKVGDTSYYTYTVYNEVPLNIDMVDIDIHQQPSYLPEYNENSANFVGKLKLFTASNDIYLRQTSNENSLITYNSDGEKNTSWAPGNLYSSLTPNLYKVYSVLNSPPNDFLGLCSKFKFVIEPTVGGENMKPQDKEFAFTGYKGYYGDPEPVPVGNTQVIPNKGAGTPADTSKDIQFLSAFKLPEDLKEFNLCLYNTSSNTQNWKMPIKLTRS